MSRPARLAAKVKAVNRVHAEANRLYPILANYFAQFVGQKIVKQDGGLLHKIDRDLPALPEGWAGRGEIQVWRHGSHHTLSWGIRASEHVSDEQGNTSYEIVLYVGDLEGAVLAKLYQAPQYRADFTAEEIASGRERLEQAKKVVSQIEGTLHPFGEHDR
jgi:hypothetical protein